MKSENKFSFLKNQISTIITAIVTVIGSFLVFKTDYKRTDNELLNINAENFSKLYEYQDNQIRLLTKRVDSLAYANMRLQDELTRLKIAYYKQTENEITANYYINKLNTDN